MKLLGSEGTQKVQGTNGNVDKVTYQRSDQILLPDQILFPYSTVEFFYYFVTNICTIFVTVGIFCQVCWVLK